MLTTRIDGREIYRTTQARQLAVKGKRILDAASMGGLEELWGFCGRKDATHIVAREGNKFKIYFYKGTLCDSLSGPDI